MNCPKCNAPMQFDIELDYGEHSPYYCRKCGYAEGCSNFFSEEDCNRCTEYAYCKKWFEISNGQSVSDSIPRCKHCGKKCTEINEYVIAASLENITPEQYVTREEGTYNRKTNTFECTSCYVKTLF